MQVGDDIYLTSAGPTPKGDRPFLDRFNLKTLKPTRVWQSDTDALRDGRRAARRQRDAS